MSRDTTKVTPGQEAKVDHFILKALSIILMVVFAIGIAIYSLVFRDVLNSGNWTGY